MDWCDRSLINRNHKIICEFVCAKDVWFVKECTWRHVSDTMPSARKQSRKLTFPIYRWISGLRSKAVKALSSPECQGGWILEEKWASTHSTWLISTYRKREALATIDMLPSFIKAGMIIIDFLFIYKAS